MAESEDLYSGMEVDNDSSTMSIAMGTEPLDERNLEPPGFDNSRNPASEELAIEVFDGRKYLKVERSANLRKGAREDADTGENLSLSLSLCDDIIEATEVLESLVGSRAYSAARRLVCYVVREASTALGAERYSIRFNSRHFGYIHSVHVLL